MDNTKAAKKLVSLAKSLTAGYRDVFVTVNDGYLRKEGDDITYTAEFVFWKLDENDEAYFDDEVMEAAQQTKINLESTVRKNSGWEIGTLRAPVGQRNGEVTLEFVVVVANENVIFETFNLDVASGVEWV